MKENPVKKIVLEADEIEKLQKGIEVLKLDPEQDLILIVKPSSRRTYTEIILDKLGLDGNPSHRLTHDPNGKPF